MKNFTFAILFASALGLADLVAAEMSSLTLSHTISLPGVEGRFDHAAYDAQTHRLFFAALGNDTLEVVNVETSQRVHTIKGLKKPTGVLFLTALHRIVVACGDDGTCRFFDAASYEEQGRVTDVDDADNLRFDAKSNLIYLGYGDGALGVIDPISMKLVRSLSLPKHPESFQLEQNGTRIFVNVPDAKQIAVVDRKAGKVIDTWPLEDVRANFPMALAEAQHHLFIGCRQPARLLAFDTQSGKRIAEAAMSGDVDDLFFEAATSRLIASCGEGFVDVFHFAPPTTLQRTGQIPSAAGARTAFFAPKPAVFCLAVPHRARQGAEIRVFSLAPLQ